MGATGFGQIRLHLIPKELLCLCSTKAKLLQNNAWDTRLKSAWATLISILPSLVLVCRIFLLFDRRGF